jgi:hypothetical protein
MDTERERKRERERERERERRERERGATDKARGAKKSNTYSSEIFSNIFLTK